MTVASAQGTAEELLTSLLEQRLNTHNAARADYWYISVCAMRLFSPALLVKCCSLPASRLRKSALQWPQKATDSLVFAAANVNHNFVSLDRFLLRSTVSDSPCALSTSIWKCADDSPDPTRRACSPLELISRASPDEQPRVVSLTLPSVADRRRSQNTKASHSYTCICIFAARGRPGCILSV